VRSRVTPDRRLAGEIAIVTGASSGIGAATARELARQGAAVVLAARRAGELEAQVRAVEGDGGRAVAVPTDLAHAEQVTRLAERAVEAFGRVDVLVNAAGASWSRPLAVTSPEDVTRILAVNLLGAIRLTHELLPGMLGRRHGAIVTVGSLSGRVAMEPLYSATKYGLRGFSHALRRQLAGTGVSASLVSPGNIRTAMTSNVDARMPGPELVATTIANLVVHPRREVVVPRIHYSLAWLEQLLPGVADVAHRKRNWARVEGVNGTW
jgi:NAD(P)-dependent dehydrogenase (short-subunit alcohol dehydrogenase family)